MPLAALIAISATGLLLTFSSALLDGAGYEFLAILHMGIVVLSLVFIPFGKFFHVVQRPGDRGRAGLQGTSQAREGSSRAGAAASPSRARRSSGTSQATMDELDLGYPGWIETCPRCKRLERGEAYCTQVKGGF